MAVSLITLAEGTVTTSGTEVKAAGAANVSNAIKAWITAPAANTGTIYVGDASVSTTRGIAVIKGTTLILDAPVSELLDLSAIWVDAATNGDKFQVTYLSKI